MATRAVVVEDERLPRVELCALLAEEGVRVVGTAATVDEAVSCIEEHEPDVVFLDIQLGRESAFDIFDRTRADFTVIFVTAYDQHAVRAFELNALDYLLKPVEPERLRAALGRLSEGPVSDPPVTTERLQPGDRLFVRADNRWRFLKIDDVYAIEASRDYARLRMADGASLLLPRPLRDWEAKLPPSSFVRIHRSTIVNLGFVTDVEEWFNRTYLVHVRGIKKPYTMSRRYASRLKQ